MIRKASLSDLSRIAEINVASWRFAYKEIVSEEILYKDFLVEDRIKVVKKWMADSSYSLYVYEDDENKIIKAMMGIGKCEDQDKQDSFELHFLYVEPFYSRHGIGTQMIKCFEEEGQKQGYKEFIIWVLEKNEIGKRCYLKSGYSHDGSTKIFKRLNMKEIRYIKNLT